MPIYAYKCESCGNRQDVLQKISDPVLSICPSCGAATFVKQLTAAGFQLKGSGWYVTDFRDAKKPAADKAEAKSADAPAAAAPAGGAPAAAPAAAAAPASAPAEKKASPPASDAA